MWKYSRIERLEELIGRSREAERYLARERCDRHSREERAVIDRRLAIVMGRLRLLYASARLARRAARTLTIG